MSKYAKPLIFIAALAFLGTLAFVLPVREYLLAGLQWVDAHRAVAWSVYILAYIVATVLLLPGSVITIAAGFIFGLPAGTAIVSVGSVIGATAAFSIGRSLVRDWVVEKIETMPRFGALDRATRHDGFTIVLLARLSPLFPFNLLNYGLGVTAVRLRDYFFASWIGMLPGTILYVYLGTLANDLTFIMSGDVDSGAGGTILLIVGFIATLVLTVFITRKATRALKSQLDARAAPETEA